LWILELPRLLEEVELEALIPEAYTFIYNLQNFLIDILHKLKYTHLESWLQKNEFRKYTLISEYICFINYNFYIVL